ncbi:helix-turn-helix domain-containing protein [Cryobacterium cryoconiti]|uniref:helix-turn-helix domain-containing protein n=1 Tax=Cryobacterium cryoconiti TaxID=1259239 RepID=UPI00141BBC43|nr:helix-turn-helix transcriptional regulator [Cryobacterium cryoconiti]
MPSQPRPGRLTRGVARILYEEYRANSVTQTALGDAAGVSQSQMSKLLRGDRTLNLDQLEAVCFMLGLSPGEVITAAEVSGF